MFAKALSTAAVALAASTLVSAQTFTDCDPTKKKCKAATALGKDVDIDFTKTKGDDYLHTLPGTEVEYDDEKGAVFSIANEKQAPTKASDDYIFFGELECEVQAAPGAGIVTSIVLQSDDLDEIDWEWVGADTTQVQTNYFSKGDTSTYDRGGYHDVENPVGMFHKYGIVWTQDKIDWTIDGNVIRTLTSEEADNGKKFPQSPMQIKIGTWTAGRSDAAEGTIEWGGGKADFKKGPFIGYYKNCKIVDYMGGEKGAKEYAYPDNYDGTWEQIIIKKSSSSDKDDDEKSSSSSSAKASSTSAESSSSTEASSSSASSESASSSASESASSASESASESASSASSSASEASSASSAEATPTPSGNDDNEDDAAATGADSEESNEDGDDAEAAGLMNHANLALGAAGLFAAFML